MIYLPLYIVGYKLLWMLMDYNSWFTMSLHIRLYTCYIIIVSVASVCMSSCGSSMVVLMFFFKSPYRIERPRWVLFLRVCSLIFYVCMVCCWILFLYIHSNLIFFLYFFYLDICSLKLSCVFLWPSWLHCLCFILFYNIFLLSCWTFYAYIFLVDPLPPAYYLAYLSFEVDLYLVLAQATVFYCFLYYCSYLIR